MNRQEEFSEACEEAAHMICKKIVEVDIPIEVNIHGAMKGKHPFRNGDRFYYPHKEFWKIASNFRSVGNQMEPSVFICIDTRKDREYN